MVVWIPVVGFEAFYEVSDGGDVRSSRKAAEPKRKRKGWAAREALVRPWLSRGYRKVELRDGTGGRRRAKVGTLVLEAFVGPRPECADLCHNDGNRENDALANLRWDSHKSNLADRIIHGTSNRGERCGTAKLNREQVRQILAATAPQTEIAERFSISQSQVSRIKLGQQWQHEKW